MTVRGVATIATCLVLMSAGTPVLAAHWYVSPKGSDSSAGTLAAPFRTIQRAADVAAAGDTVEIEAGVYRETVRPAHSGAPGAPIVFEALHGEPVVISGADPLSGWSHVSGSVYSTSMPWSLGSGSNQIFVHSEMLPEARWPHAAMDPMRPILAQATAGTTGSTIYDPKLTQPMGYWTGATVWLLGGNRPWEPWIAQATRVVSSAPGSVRLGSLPMPQSDYAPVPGTWFCIIGGPASALDSAGEWLRSGDRLSVWLPGGASPNEADIEAKQRQYAFVLDGRSDITISGLHIIAAGISLQHAQDCRVDGCRLRYISQFIDFGSGWNTSDTSGVAVDGTGNVVSSCRIEYSAGNGISLLGSGNTVENCYVRGCDYSGQDSAGIRVTGSHQRVVGNTVTECFRTAILNRDLGASEIAHNDVSYYAMVTKDCGGTYCYETDGKATIIAYNVFHDAVDALFSGHKTTCGPYLDNGTTNTIVMHNLVYDVDEGTRMNTPSNDNTVVQNTFANNSTGPSLAGYSDFAGTVFADNIFMGSIDPHTHGTFIGNLMRPVSPEFDDSAAGDYRLKAGSPAIRAGVPYPPYSTPPGDKAPSAGAFDYRAPAWPFGCTVAPKAPAGLGAVPEHRAVKVTWLPVTGAARYEVYERTAAFGPYRLAATVAAAAAMVSNLRPGITHTFVVRAISRDGSGPLSGPASAAALP